MWERESRGLYGDKPQTRVKTSDIVFETGRESRRRIRKKNQEAKQKITCKEEINEKLKQFKKLKNYLRN